MQATTRPLNIAIAGLGAASGLVLPAFDQDIEGVRLAAGCDIRPEACEEFRSKYGLPVYETMEALAVAPEIDAIWIETPNHLHCEHAIVAALGGKHVICAKPVGVSVEECERMIAAARENNVHLMQGHAKTFDPPIEAVHRIVESGEYGQIVHIDTLLYNDWLQRPRLAEELDRSRGGGIVLRQGPHHIDIVRRIACSPVVRVRASAGQHDPHFTTEGNYAAHLEFANGASAHVSFNGYGWFDSNELAWNIGVYGKASSSKHQTPPPRRTSVLDASAKYGEPAAQTSPSREIIGDKQPFFGLTIAACERAVIRQSPDGLYIYDAQGSREVVLPPNPGRAAELIELRDAIRNKRRVFPDGEWGRETLRICLAILESASSGRDVKLPG